MTTKSHPVTEPLFSVGTWDTDLQAYAPQVGVTKSLNMTRAELKTAIRELRALGYTAHRFGNCRDGHEDNDWTVLIERTDGMEPRKILESWER